MSQYTTGELAKLCGVTVRTVQYYDSRALLTPSALSEGGRRLYSDSDLQKLKIICFLRETGLSISNISDILSEEHSRELVSLLLEQQEAALKAEISERQQQLEKLGILARELKNAESFCIESIADIAYRMNNRKKLRRVRLVLLAVGIPMELVEAALLALWIVKGIWLPYALGMIPILGLGVWLSAYYFKNVAYICPQCHSVFQPRFKEAFWASHTPNTRKLSCPGCGRKGYCVETAAEQRPSE